MRVFEDGLDVLRIDRPGIPEFGALNARLEARTGWNVVAVPGLVPAASAPTTRALPNPTDEGIRPGSITPR